MPPLPVKVHGHQSPRAEREVHEEHSGNDSQWQVQNQPTVFREALTIEAHSREGRNYVVVSEQPEIGKKDEQEEIGPGTDRYADRDRQERQPADEKCIEGGVT